MVDFNDFLVQIAQPYFLYSLVFLPLAFVCIKIYLKFNPYLSRRNQSLLWLLPLFIPVTVFLCFPPQTQIVATPFVPANIQVPCPLDGNTVLFWGQNVFSFTGLLCLSGISAAAGYFVFMLFFGKRLAMRRFHVVLMAKDEYVTLQEKVKETALQLGVSMPKVGLVDDLLPNAFTLGIGRGAVVVFSLGLLEMLDSEELSAVVSHELSHVKAKDYLFKSLSYTLNVLSFFNPLSYVVSSHAQKERELLADENGAVLLGKPALMAKVLERVESVVQQFPAPSLSDRFSSSLFLVSPLAHRPGILASHPQVAQRVQNIHASINKPSVKHRKMATTMLLSLLLLSVTLIAAYSTIQAQKQYLQNVNAPVNQYRVLMYNSTAHEFQPQFNIVALLFPNFDSYLDWVNGLSPGWQITERGSIKFHDGSEMFYDSINGTLSYSNGTQLMLYNTR